MYTTAKDKAHDSNRLTALHELQLAIEQYEDDLGSLPTNSNFVCLVSKGYIKSVPYDVRDSIKNRTDGTASTSGHDYRYRVAPDGTKFELSVNFASKTNDTKEKNNGGDGGNDDNRYEIGVGTTSIDTSTGSHVIYSSGTCSI